MPPALASVLLGSMPLWLSHRAYRLSKLKRGPVFISSKTFSILGWNLYFLVPIANVFLLQFCRRGLSKYFQGKSQSFTSLTNVRSLEDLAKPENPYNKKLKSCKSYGGLLSAQNHHTSSSSHHLPRANSSSRLITKKASNSRGSCSSLVAKRTPSFVGNNRAPIPSAPPHGSTGTLCSFSNQNPLFVWCCFWVFLS